MIRLGDGTELANHKTQDAIDHLWKYTHEFFNATEADQEMIKLGFGPDLKSLESAWKLKVNDIFLMIVHLKKL